MKEIIGSFQAQGLRFGIVAAHFNEMITRKLFDGAVEALKRHGADVALSTAVWVPGSFEIPVAAKKLAESGQYDAIITLGTIIKGSTAHFDYVAAQTASGVANVSQITGVPVIFGILTTETIEQALERAGTKMGNKGFEAAQAAIEMANVMRELKAPVKQYAVSSS
ncbi:6,7-dimethyl-8-ribityllumazine synthase [Waddlia chondrophila 2032/99]|uniref:6,7-dimethyl-8-ribityllumazine synthase n=2 Tax=Waddlia chondrophila TaxID=71667 RepID=D6YWD0_WADCW|nr:6,7-dimethyl-8-ribityllumazine synthase [Waddlia chondrophila]ADI38441.1 riboflavin synthase, beta subunit [Waddlia chondrophila WSU 86-1044]CCB91527.1 6,7-dimethyl-8-ribityllumazine synthase [Waddlia chondrophila 2032/99]